MARQWRIGYVGALYHILSRGNEQRRIFSDDKDRLRFLEVLGKMSARFDIEIYAYVLMGNHYHLLIKTNVSNLSRGMHWLGTTYTGRFNLRHGRSGHLFQGRFRSIIVENEAYLMRLSCYIHRNPLRSGLVRRLADYPWSSYPVYAYGRPGPEWLNKEFILSQLSVRDKCRAYRKMVQEYSREGKRLWAEVRHGLVLGSEEFIDRIKSNYLFGKPHEEIPQQRRVLKDIEAAALLSKGVEILRCDVEAFRQGARIRESQKDDRDLLIYFLWERGVYKNDEIGDLFGLGYSSVSRRANILESRLKKDRKLQEKYAELKSLIKI